MQLSSDIYAQLAKRNVQPAEVGVVIVDHGSRREESNAMLLQVVEVFRRRTNFSIVEPAHMELAEPSLGAAFDKCVAAGAKLVVVHPYFLLPGRHWKNDIPALAKAAAAKHEGIAWLVTAPLGVHERMVDIMMNRIEDCLAYTTGLADRCTVCSATGDQRCELES